jgi:hypothetical protein
VVIHHTIEGAKIVDSHPSQERSTMKRAGLERSLTFLTGERLASLVLLCAVAASGGRTLGAEWIELSGERGLEAWKPPTGQWMIVGSVGLDPADPRRLASEPGTGVLVNGRTGRTHNLISKESFGDLEAHLEFLIPRGSNSGVKFAGLYEVQIDDCWGRNDVTASDCGGIYPRAELLPRYHHIDQGHPPRVNAARPAGAWQTLDVIFRAPRFDAAGKKVANARFVKVVLNGQVVHEDLEVATPTGHAWRLPEVAAGPLLLQADHGPVAFRNVRVRRREG